MNNPTLKTIALLFLLSLGTYTVSAQYDHFGRLERRFLWGVSGGASIADGRPNNMFSDVALRPGYDFGLDFRHKLGNEYNIYFVFLHYGVNMGSFYYKTQNDIWESALGAFFEEYNPMFLHLDIPLGIEFPLGYFCHNRMSFNVQTTLTSRFYFFSPNQTYNLATTNSLAYRFDKIQLQASYSYFFLSQLSKNMAPEYKDWKVSEWNIGLKFYF